ncbi:hypothetical protein ALC56_08186 [Trachymyrmex septentrionalis]|uniref:Uncharacterized protein n=1 Tax=Trachymyrmex septentrionalis TaxID=34720 RepID=A0A151JVA9_9HYME|nr:hypothetical protein ALC56_08186 [Trachymyrmex septentrionalis]
MRSKENLYLKSLLENTFREQFKEDREVYKVRVKNQILRTQKENQRTYNIKRVGSDDDPGVTWIVPRSTCAEYMKPWIVD